MMMMIKVKNLLYYRKTFDTLRVCTEMILLVFVAVVVVDLKVKGKFSRLLKLCFFARNFNKMCV